MRILNRALLAVAFGAMTAVVAACPASLDDRCAGGACVANSSSGDSGNPDVKLPANCDLSKLVKDSPSCVDSDVGVFVSPTGDDAASGKKDAPLKTIQKGVELAAASGRKRVYVCDGQYVDNVEIRLPVSIVGGLDCNWNPADKRPTISPIKGIALRIAKVSDIAVQEVQVVGSADPKAPGDSAIAVFVSESSNVILRALIVKAGDATSALDAGTKSNWSGAATVGSTAAMGGGGPSCSCLDGTSSSKGGNGGAIGVGGTTGSSVPNVGSLNGGGGGDTCLMGGPGDPGGPTKAGDGASRNGSLSNVAWTNQSNATAGMAGGPGQGGGGGGGRNGVAGGGGGGCGGCGGGGGEAGPAGGSSFGVLSFQSTIAIVDSEIATSKGGNGGKGGSGQDGQAGATGGVGACDGGPGGNGAGGSGGGGGAGGHSVPVGFTAPEPTVTGGKLLPGTPGNPGGAGAPGAGPGTAGNPGAPGVSGRNDPKLLL